MTDATAAAVSLIRHVGTAALKVYHRLDVTVDEELPDRPCLIVGSHGFGGVVDLNVLATVAALDDLDERRPLTILTHQLAWTLGVGRAVEAVGAVPASRDAARAALTAGHNVLVFPGGDLESGKPWTRRNRVEFHRRSGFARLAIDDGVPIVPTVTVGAGESLFVLTDGRALAQRLGLPAQLRYNVAPVSLSIPWGLNVGLVGLLPYVPLPTKLRTAIMPAMEPHEKETAEELAARVQAVMQRRVNSLTAGRIPILGP